MGEFIYTAKVSHKDIIMRLIVYSDARQIGAGSNRNGKQPLCADIPASVFRSAGHLSARYVTVT